MAITNFGFKNKFNEEQSVMICSVDVVLSKALLLQQDNVHWTDHHTLFFIKLIFKAKVRYGHMT